jgi:hypothetical protein
MKKLKTLVISVELKSVFNNRSFWKLYILENLNINFLLVYKKGSYQKYYF